MSMLANVTRGKIKRPYLVLVYGPDGVGKTTFGAEAPDPIFLGSERGTDNLDVARFPSPKSWVDVEGAMLELVKGKHEFRTLVIDSLDWLEPMLHAKICKAHNVRSIELASGGYGKGYIEALNDWVNFKNALNLLRDERNMNIVLLAHADTITHHDPQTQMEYKRHELKLHKKASAMFREFVDAVLFISYKTYGKKDGQRTLALGDGTRVMFTERRPGFDAKNRYGLPPAMPMILGESWSNFVAAAERGVPESLESLTSRIDGMLTMISDPALKEIVLNTVTEAGFDTVRLTKIAQRLAIRLDEEQSKCVDAESDGRAKQKE